LSEVAGSEVVGPGVSNPEVPRAGRMRVLSVDDSAFSRRLLEHALEGEPYELLFAEDGKQALEAIEKFHPGLVITDWMLPDTSGPELCRKIRESVAEYTYLILLTSNVEKERIVEGLEAGADDYLTKPFHAKELAARVRTGKRILEMNRTIEEKNRLLEKASRTDFLTELPNRRAVEEYARKQLRGAIRHGFPFWVIVADLNKFKAINDRFGHLAGDEVLRRFACVLKKNTRVSDICGRMGGDEFMLVVTHAEREGVKEFVERLRGGFAREKFEFDAGELSAGFGVGGFEPPETPEFERLLARADAALYKGKSGGEIEIRIKDQ
jgi:two-component system, cell cycle response regulator